MKKENKIRLQKIIATIIFVVIGILAITALSLIVTYVMERNELVEYNVKASLGVLVICILYLINQVQIEKEKLKFSLKTIKGQWNLTGEIALVLNILVYAIFTRAILSEIPLMGSLKMTEQICSIAWWSILVSMAFRLFLRVATNSKPKEKPKDV